MVIYPGVFLLFSTIIYPIVAEVLTQSFVVRLMEMEQLMQDLNHVIEDQKHVIDDLKYVIEDQKHVIEDQQKMLQTFKSGVYFTVKMTQDRTFLQGEVIKFDQTVTNVGGSYIDDSSNADYGKFIAPQNGTYQFSATFYNAAKFIGADLMKNGVFITGASNGGVGAAGLSAILDLVEGDEVYLVRIAWVDDDAAYNRNFVSFSGVLMRADF